MTLENIHFPDVSKVALSLSGGLDSTTLLYMLVDRYGKDNVFPVSFMYQQKQMIELEHASASCKALGVHHHTVDVSFLGNIARSVSANIKGSDIEMPTIVDILGKTVIQSKALSNNAIDVSSLSSGVYVLSVSSEDGAKQFKFQKK